MDIDTLKAILITNAPDPESWFVPKMDDPWPELIFPPGASQTTELNATNESRAAAAEYRLEYHKQRKLQWPIVWADEILKKWKELE